jgi:hypothetical protein
MALAAPLFRKEAKGFIHFFSKRNEPKKILLTPNPFLQMKWLN